MLTAFLFRIGLNFFYRADYCNGNKIQQILTALLTLFCYLFY
ncbi:unknown [[Mannheimia] succiniciproducens MBEL55E]|uniref:Uncharacterized protein n=1 Tax=Mannheimia succiniciproducens (strain KCTC 0769BP / MBEL55E) TaxID=221988 RepID=Q65UA5_MANSM|nr:unknown [[Mannheimia] succiniciproducens MBEL55E]